MECTLVLGNRNYSSWSMRAWLALERTGVPHEEVVIPLDRPDTAERIRRYSPSSSARSASPTRCSRPS